jgi:TrmH family RNA methyltransferase
MSALAFTNSRVRRLRRLLGRRSARHDEGCFVVEGPVLVAEAVAAGWHVEEQFVAAEADGVVTPAVDGAGPVHQLAPGVLERVASTQTPQDPIAVVRLPDPATGRAVLDRASFVVVLDRVSDPGNLGTILRSAEAAGADAVVLTPGGVDPYNPKVVRASAGAVFHVPVADATVEDVRAAGFTTVGTTSHDAPGRTVVRHTDADLTGRVAIVLGNEAAGLPEAWTDETGPIDRWVTIPHAGRSESLNVAMAATVLVFEVTRQRSLTAGRGDAGPHSTASNAAG